MALDFLFKEKPFLFKIHVFELFVTLRIVMNLELISSAFLIGLVTVVSNDVEKDGTGRNVRLVGGPVDGLSGRLEVFEQGSWGTACNTTFDYRAASVICRQLGFAGGLDVHDIVVFGRGNEGVALSECICAGSEPTLSNCQLRRMSEETQPIRRSPLRACASHQRDVGIICQNDSDVVRGIRLSGRNDVNGRLEVFVRGKWGTVCDRGFTYSAARVACTQLGLHSAIRPILFGLEVPRGPDLGVALSDLRCSGDERFLQDCPNSDPLRPICQKYHAVGLICEHDSDTVFFQATLQRSVVGHANNELKSFLINGEDVFHFEMSGGSGQILLLLNSSLNGSANSSLRIILRKFQNTAMVLGRSWTAVEHSLWFCQANESTCAKNASQLESVLGYRKWTNYTISATHDGMVLRIESGQLGSATTLLSALLPVSFGDSFRVSLGAGKESEVIYRVRRSHDVNRCLLRADEEEMEEDYLTKCGDAFVGSALCRHCGCCYDPSLRPQCYHPIVASDLIDERPCLRSLSAIIGRVVVMSKGSVCVGQTTVFAIGVETYHDSFKLSLDEGNGNVSKGLQLARATNLPGWITSRYGELADGLPYWAFIGVVYDRAGRYSVRAMVDAYRMKTYSSTAHVAIVENRKSKAYLYDDGPTYYDSDYVDLFFVVKNYGAEMKISFEVQDPTGAITHSEISYTNSTSLPQWALKKFQNSTNEPLANFESIAFTIFSVSIGKYLVKAVANSSCYIESVQTTIDVLPRPTLREVIGEVRFLVDDSYQVNVVSYIVLLLSRLTRTPKLEVRFGYDDEYTEVPVPMYIRTRLPEFAIVKLSLLPEGSLSWIVLTHTFLLAGTYSVDVIYSDAKWDYEKDSVSLSIRIPITCNTKLTFTGGGSTVESATVYSRSQLIRLVGSLVFDCAMQTTLVEWSVQKVLNGTGNGTGNGTEERLDVVDPSIKSSGLVLLVPKFTLEYGVYVFLLKVTLRTYNPKENVTREIWVRVEPALLKAEITQGITQVVEWLSIVTIDASRSRDPDVEGQLTFANLSFTWFCLRNDKKLSDPISEEDSCFVNSSVNWKLSGPTIQFNSTQLRLIHFPSMYTFHLLISKSGSRTASARHVLMVAAKVFSRSPASSTTISTAAEEDDHDDVEYHLDVEPIVDLMCERNCVETEYAKEELELVAICRNCVPGESLSYVWSLVTLEGENLTDVDWDVVSTGGNTQANIILLTSGIETSVDRLFITVEVHRELGESGAASFAIKVTPLASALKLQASTSGAESLSHQILSVLCGMAAIYLEIVLFDWLRLRRRLPVR